MKVAIIGAGISGLTLAYKLKNFGIETRIFEAGSTSGGYIQSLKEEGYLIESGPQSFLNNEPVTMRLISELRLNSQLISTNPESQWRYIYYNNKLNQIHPSSLIKSNYISLYGKIRTLLEPITSLQKSIQNETVESFFIRHFGQEVTDKIIRPFCVGIFASDISELLMQESFPYIKDIENEAKSLLLYFLRMKKHRPSLKTFKGGLSTLTKQLTELTSDILQLNSPVYEIKKSKSGWIIEDLSFDHIVLSVGPKALSKIHISGVPMADLDIPHAPIISLSLGIDGPLPHKGFGTLIHPHHKRKMLGFLHSSDVFINRAPRGKSLLTSFVGGAYYPEVLDWEDSKLLSTVLEDLKYVYDGWEPSVEKTWIFRHPDGLCQYTANYLKKLHILKQRLKEVGGLHINSHLMGGISINHQIRRSIALGDQLNKLYLIQ